MLKDEEFYARLVDALDALHDKRLGSAWLWSKPSGETGGDGCPCALGAYLYARGYTREALRDCSVGYHTGVPKEDLPSWQTWSDTYRANDLFEGTPEARWAYMKGWTQAQLEKSRE